MQRQQSDMVVRRKYKRYSKQKMTYLGLIAYIIQNAPERRLTFCELMNSIGSFVDGDRKGLENNIRVCLSINECFVKVPMNPLCPNAKRNFWRVDESKITPNMLRRHFSGMSDIFPDFYGNSETSTAKNATAVNVNCTEKEKKFTSSFSIESILQRECSAPKSPAYFPSNITNVCPGPSSADNGLACKRKTWDYHNQIDCANFKKSYSHFSFPPCTLDQMNNGCSSTNPPSKRICSVSELSYYCAAPESIRPFPFNSVTWAYI